MVFNKKELIGIQDKVQQIAVKHDQFAQQSKQQHEQMVLVVEKRFQELKEKQFYYFDEFEKNLQNFRDLNMKYQKGFDDLSVMKNNMVEKVVAKVEREMRIEQEKQAEGIKKEQQQRQELQQAVTVMKQEIERLMAVSQKVKEMDFNLMNYAKKLQDEQADKIKLMQQIDHLETLIAKMRRGQHR